MSGRYGPNTPAVEALLAQARTITPDQAKALAAARVAARDVALAAAWVAARDAAQAAARAAEAVVVRDLITPEQYQLLAGPWESVMGPIEAAA